ncbi:preprotein translocase subunit SecE [Mycobacterium manitobense]|uniref:Protein translocase subunit SecE n=1 Tax=[Mycobacterium] manitobense TaxID=190147 RepID=A0A9X2YK89_9MYCO|nr:preprotein translocase subunit SecE [[Mycobacterium] manitobense]MCV7169498.1 preprotein translocase subunit SecE [[Mycobacterium] manitobense]
MSDERDSAGSPDDGAGAGLDAGTDSGKSADTRGQTAVATRPLRPTGKRSRRPVGDVDGADTDTAPETDTGDLKDGNGPGKKTVRKKKEPGGSRNPFLYVLNYLKQVVAELRKVIWPNRKQMVSYTSVVLVFLVFMVALISGADYGLGRLIGLVFGAD